MGYIRHNAIVVVGYRWAAKDEDDRNNEIDDAHRAAVNAGCIVSPIVEGAINSTCSFMVAPDGSKEGWDSSDRYDEARDRFIAWLRENSTYDQGWFSWAEVVVGPDDCEAHVERHAWDAVASTANNSPQEGTS